MIRPISLSRTPRPPRARGRALTDQLDAVGGERVDQLHQRVDVAAHDAVAGFHALDRWQREPRALRQFALVDAEQGARGPDLGGRNHGTSIVS